MKKDQTKRILHFIHDDQYFLTPPRWRIFSLKRVLGTRLRRFYLLFVIYRNQDTCLSLQSMDLDVSIIRVHIFLWCCRYYSEPSELKDV